MWRERSLHHHPTVGVWLKGLSAALFLGILLAGSGHVSLSRVEAGRRAYEYGLAYVSASGGRVFSLGKAFSSSQLEDPPKRSAALCSV